MDTEQEVDYQEDSLTADLAAAWENAFGEEDGDIEGDVHQSSADPDESGVEDGSEGGLDSSSPEGSSTEPEPVQGAGDTPEQKSEADEKPPVALSATAREAWKDTPPAIKAEIKKREADFAKGIQQYAENAKRAMGMDAVLQPYSQYFAMNGGAGNTIKTLLQTGAGLQMGSAQQKAELVANIIKQFSVDIRTLDNLLVGEAPPPEVQQNQQIEQMLQQRLAPYQQQMQQFQQMQQQRVMQEQQQIGSEIQQFASQNEFYNDVKMDMADLMDLAANRGRHMSLQEAYDRACQAHPEISKIMQTRGRAPTEQKRRAASSISGGPAGGGSAEPDSLRGAIEMAWENAGRT